MKEEKIIKGCKAKKRRAQDALVKKYAGKLMSICRRYTMDQSIAKDALQEAFLNIFKYIHTYNGSGPFEAWLIKIAVNSSLSYRKKIRFETSFEEINEAALNMANIPEIYARLELDEILSLLSRLSESQYTIFNLIVVEGYKHRDVGKMLNISERTSRATLSRARKRLIDIIRKEEEKEHSILHPFPIKFKKEF